MHSDYKSIDPCTNFDAYVCGGYPENHPFEATDTLTDLQNQSKDIIVQLLTHPYNPQSDATSDDEDVFNMVADDFAACLDVNKIEKSGLAGVPGIIVEVQKLFPIDGYASNETLTGDYEKWADALAYLNSVGVPVFGDFGTIVDVQNPESMIPAFNVISPTGDKAIPATYDISTLASTSNVTNIEALVSTLIPQAAEQGVAAQLATSVLEFSTQYAGIFLAASQVASVDLDDLLYFTTTVEEVASAAPALTIPEVIERRAPEGYEIERIQVQVPDVWMNVSALISQTPAATLQTILILSAHGNYASYVAGSVDSSADRSSVCADYLDKSLAWMTSKLYLEQKYSDEDRKAVTTIMKNLLGSFGNRAKNVDFIDEDTKALIQEKLDDMTLRIGYPTDTPDAMNATSLKAYYDGVEITSSHFSNVLSIRKWYSKLEWKALSFPVDETTWPNHGVHSWVANARQWRERNTALIPAGISQTPLFNRNAPSYISYGALGVVAGHEITHGFDSVGRHFDQRGRLQDWWSQASADTFDNKTECFVEQYSKVPIIGFDGRVAKSEKNETVYVDGAFTLAENIADAGGLLTSYDIWKKLDNACPEKGLPGLEGFTRDQLFFIAYGQVWCSRLTPEQAATKGAHALPFARARVAPQNSAAFLEAFSCKQKQPTCELW
ncbi:hypothetical protein NPX13_g7393 [Xylaria arbuscula]|uniref:Endothelin-converting enzyme 1 n=1 Tax=Xylaria arbuscula TaxID=114810 RepID=A0A9W8NB10_9PEZI|nr:hypothetical protein NPX13_g7393 [Xylaria arbuscula]